LHAQVWRDHAQNFVLCLSCSAGVAAGLLDMYTDFPVHPDLHVNLNIPLTVITPYLPQPSPSPASSSDTSLPVFDIGLLLNPPSTSVDYWVPVRVLVLTTDVAWPSQQQLAAQVAAAGGTLRTSSSGVQVGSKTT
jgi:hypothetical protein